jgi:hypothetical protein
MASLGFQGSAKWWVLRHRLHHRSVPHLLLSKKNERDGSNLVPSIQIIHAELDSRTTRFMILIRPQEDSGSLIVVGSSESPLILV